MKSFWTLVAVGVAASALAACSWVDWPPTGTLARPIVPRQKSAAVAIVKVTAPSAGEDFGSEAFVFWVQTEGSPPVAWDWDFGGGVEPNESDAIHPAVTLLNPSFSEAAFYVGSVTVRDAKGHTDTAVINYSVGPRQANTPTFGELPGVVLGDFSFSVVSWGAEATGSIDIELVDSPGVIVWPESLFVANVYGPFDVDFTSYNSGWSDVRVRVTLDNGYRQNSVELFGVVPGLPGPPGSIVVVPSETVVEVGDIVTATICVSEIEYPAAYFWVAMPYCDGLEGLTWSIGWSGGDYWEKDGPFWEEFPDPVGPYLGPRLCIVPDYIELMAWAQNSNPSGAPPGTSGPLFNIEYKAVEPGTWYIEFLPGGTHYGEPDEETWHNYADYLGCEVTVLEAEE